MENKDKSISERFGRRDITVLSAKYNESGKNLLAFSEEDKLNIVEHHALKRQIEGAPRKKKRSKRY